MAIAIHGDDAVDEHFKDLTEQADKVLNDLNNLTKQASDIQDGNVLDKTWNMYLVNQKKVDLEKALPVFENLVAQIKDKIRIRNEQSSIFRAKRNSELQELEDLESANMMDDEGAETMENGGVEDY